jgi:SEFIR domain/Effector-associated domain 7
MNTESKPSKIFISYSHDSEAHTDRVLELADRLRQDGIDANIDQYEQAPSQGWQRWMLNEIEDAQFVLIICTEQYDRRFRGKEESGKGKGATWEGTIVTQELYDSQGRNLKFIPVLLNSNNEGFVPIPLRSSNIYKLDRENGYELLYRRLTDQHETPAPPLGTVTKLPVRDRGQNTGENSSSETKTNSTPTQPSTTNFSKKSIVALLNKALSSNDISNLCFDDFPDVYRDFTSGQVRSERVNSLVDYADRNREIPKLLAAIKKMNSNGYDHFISNISEYE